MDITGLLGTIKNDGYLEGISSPDEPENEGSVIAKAGSITQSGTVLANAKGGINGGYIDFYGENELTIKTNAVVDASGGEGFVKVASGEEGGHVLVGEERLDAVRVERDLQR